MKTWILTGAMLGLGLASPALAADCELTAKASASQNSYDPFSPSNTVLDLGIVVTNAGAASCEGRFSVAPIDGSLSVSSGTNRILYRIEGPRGGGGGFANEFGPFVARIGPGGSQTLSIRFTLPAQQIIPPGDYLSDLRVTGADGANQVVNVTGGNTVLRVRVPGRTEVSISGTASSSLAQAGMAPASMNFGAAREGQTERVFVNVWSNGAVAVSLSSQNEGVLRLIANPALPPIAYSARFDGSQISLGGPVTLARTPPMTISGASYELALTLRGVSGKFAGLYQDIITVTVNQN